MGDETTNPYDLLLTKIDAMEKEITELKTKNDELAQFNKALFERQNTVTPKPGAGNQTDGSALLKKFEAYIGGK